MTEEGPPHIGASAEAGSTPVMALLAMAERVTPMGQVELERLLAARLQAPPPTPAEARVAELSALATLLESGLAVSLPHHPIAPVQVPQKDYDATRPPTAPPAETLVARYGGAAKDGWAWACRAAWGLLPDGRKRKPGLGWAHPQRGKRRVPRSGRDHVIASIRTCAFALLRRPSSNMYILWRKNSRRTRSSGGGRRNNSLAKPDRPAGMKAVYRRFPRGWASALAAANITDSELLAERRRLLAAARGPHLTNAEAPGVREEVGNLTAEQLASLRLTPKLQERLTRKGCEELALSIALGLAHELDGSLDWLAERDDGRGKPPPAHARFSPTAVREQARQAGVLLTALAACAGLDTSGWRALMVCKREPTLGQLAEMAALLRVSVTDLCEQQAADSQQSRAA